ncbi:MAG: hypothetical protein HQL61_13445 [Magnetococcales bacterium]|uniref:Secreted protein n=1 Tax=Candidatus Magnetobacterium casense TaxID=1455061 RepID=A0ABS6RYX1_9BACT|nr:hypothetical protein [Candidatus Magnetobacterium casensis]MBF0608539.1 hypothetical protein [Nitrospirota bacterium]MBV6341617.1 hypothetical protein [Candidatus Magnetobacterium casensis]
MIKAKVFLWFLTLETVLLLMLYLHSQFMVNLRQREVYGKRQLVKELTLTDFALFTEARYTRHLSQADIFTPFQDFPSAFDHFPAGSIVDPPDILRHPRL